MLIAQQHCHLQKRTVLEHMLYTEGVSAVRGFSVCGRCSEAICTLPPHILIFSFWDAQKLMRLISETCFPQLHRAIQGWLSYFNSPAVPKKKHPDC